MALLDDKVVIVTGGGHGIGKAYCRGIAREGGVAIAADIDEQAAKDAAKAIQDSGGKALGIRVDVANLASCQTMAEKSLQAFGKIDGLVNNAAIFMTVPAERAAGRKSPKKLGIALWRSTSRDCGFAAALLCRLCNDEKREAS